jgi:hypothetical protein
MIVEIDKNGVVLRKIDQQTGEDQLLNSVMDAGNWNKTNTEKRVSTLLRRPTIQKQFNSYYYDFNLEKHKYENFEEKSVNSQSWYLDSKGNIKEIQEENAYDGQIEENESVKEELEEQEEHSKLL